MDTTKNDNFDNSDKSDNSNIFNFSLNDLIPSNNLIDDDDLNDINYYNSCQYSIPIDINKLPSLNANFNLMHINSRSLMHKTTDINLLINSLNIDINIIAITETWLNEYNASLISLPNYSFVYRNRNSRNPGGGVGFFVLNGIDFLIRDDICPPSDYYESMAIEVYQKNSPNLIVFVIYRPPNVDTNQFIDGLIPTLNHVQNSSPTKLIYLLGDFNINLLANDHHDYSLNFSNALSSLSFQPHITLPTRITEYSSTLIDNIFSNNYSHHSSIVIYSDISDHLPIMVSFQITNSNKSKGNQFSGLYNTSIKNINALNLSLSSWDWSPVTDSYDVNYAFDKFIDIFNTNFIKYCPILKSNSKFKKSPWMTSALIKSAKTKNKLYYHYLKTPNDVNKTKYIKYKNYFTRLKREAEKKYITNKLEQNKNNIKKTWNLIKLSINNTNYKKTLPKIFKSSNNILDNPQDIAESFNSFFISNSNVSYPQNHKPNYKQFLPPSNPTSFFITEVDEDEILKVIKSMKPSSSQAYDKSSNFLIKHTIPFLLKPLTHCINLSLSHGIFPDCLKTTKIIPIHKNGSTNEITNYRPISIISTFSKILEKVVYSQVITFFDKHNIISDRQYGFKKNCSTELAILDLNQYVLSNIESKYSTIGVFLDISKAFDTVRHDILLGKLCNAGIRGITNDWFRTYLADRTQYVSLGSCNSTLSPIMNGIPQGSILGPLLFNLFINDVTFASKKLKYILFADDTTVLMSNSSLSTLVSELNQELINISNWMNENCLKINVKKTNFILFGPTIVTNVKNPQLFYDSVLIPRVNDIKFLGVIVSSTLKWKNHIVYISKKISKNLGAINKIKHLFPFSIVLSLYYTLIYPYLLYCIIVWGTNIKSNMNILKKCQNNFLRILYNMPYFVHITQFYNMSKLLPIQHIYILRILLFFHKIIILKKHLYFQKFLIKSNTVVNKTTRHSQDFYLYPQRTIISLKSIFVLGLKIWLSLPKDAHLLYSTNNLKKYILTLLKSDYFIEFL